jgi:2-desacetyl-2-hydroxyethyl bacteriochlorophyllide A dehydrogenase
MVTQFSGISQGSELLVFRGQVPTRFPLDLTITALQGTVDFPVKYGYASVGRVCDVGPGVQGYSTGDIVFAFNPHESCYVALAADVVNLGPRCDPRIGVFAANLETAINALFDAAPRLGESVVVIGQGVVGLLITQLARKTGAGIVITSELHERRRQLSRAVGADVVVDPANQVLAEEVDSLTRGAGADVVIEASGQPCSLDDAIRTAGKEGRVVVVSWYGSKKAELGLGTDFHRKRLTLKSSQVSNLDPSISARWTIARRRELTARYLQELILSDLISHVFPFRRAEEAYRLIDERPGEVVQVVLDYEARDA